MTEAIINGDPAYQEIHRILMDYGVIHTAAFEEAVHAIREGMKRHAERCAVISCEPCAARIRAEMGVKE